MVLGLPDRDSQILGRAAADILSSGFATAIPENIGQPGVLVMGASARSFGALPIACVHRRQTIFSMDLNWLQPGPLVPDVCGMLSQVCTLPWNGTIVKDHHTGGTRTVGPDLRERKEIVPLILSAPRTIDPGFGEVVVFYRERASDLKGHRPPQRRLMFRRDSPVPGGYFI